MFLVGASSYPVLVHTRVPCWRASVLTVAAKECSSSARHQAQRRRTQVFILGAQARSLSAHKSAHCWRTQVSTVGAQAVSCFFHDGDVRRMPCLHAISPAKALLTVAFEAQKRVHCRRTRVFLVGASACPPSAHKSVPCWRIIVASVGAQSVLCWRTSVFTVAAQECSKRKATWAAHQADTFVVGLTCIIVVLQSVWGLRWYIFDYDCYIR